METLIQKSARMEFALRAEISADQRQRLMMEMASRVRREKDEAAKEKKKREDSEFVAAMQMALAPPKAIAAFTAKLDRYDTVTVQALMDNERDLVAVREQIDSMLLRAHTLEDGRRVFKTQDGTRVYDEHGMELKADDIAPESIADDKPRAEDFFGRRSEERRLVEERKGLIEYQEKLDMARERTGDPSLTENELDALDKELGQSAPERVRKLAGDPAPADTEAKPTATPSSELARPEQRQPSLQSSVMQPM